MGSVKEERKGGILISSCNMIIEVTWNIVLELHVDLARFLVKFHERLNERVGGRERERVR